MVTRHQSDPADKPDSRNQQDPLESLSLVLGAGAIVLGAAIRMGWIAAGLTALALLFARIIYIGLRDSRR